MKIKIIVGTRHNFMKITPIIHAKKEASNLGGDINYRPIHTGQHYDKKMSIDFFEQLLIPELDANLGAGGTQAEQTEAIMVEIEKELQANPSDLVLVVGDVTSTMAFSILAKKLNTRVAHVEAGIPA
jgi:UDP-N-acetylglucosamine 2-epimerase (non-hydrolysing)